MLIAHFNATCFLGLMIPCPKLHCCTYLPIKTGDDGGLHRRL